MFTPFMFCLIEKDGDSTEKVPIRMYSSLKDVPIPFT